MQLTASRSRHARRGILLAACMLLPALPPLHAAEPPAASPITALSHDRIQLAQRRQCQRRAGPYATQDTAWRRWRQARNQGMAVSRGVVPCYDQYRTRGYCFFVFYAC